MDGSTPMTNAQFRALLSTPRPRYASEGEPSTTPKAAGGFKQPAPKKEPKFKKPAPKPKPGAVAEDDGTPAYRDRAKERREGRVDEAYMAQLEKAGVNPEALSALDEEHTKFFGGDASLSHLVKGLDYALLQREREKLGKAAAGAEEEDAAAPGPGSNIFAQQQQVSFATPRGRAVYNALFRKPPNRRHLIREMFLPRRTAFVYDFDPDTGGGDVPTTLRRSKADCPPVQERVLAAADAAVLERIAAVMAYLHSGGGGRGGRKAGRTKEAADFIRNILAGGAAGGQGSGEADTKVHDNVVVKHQSAITGAAKQQQQPQPQQQQQQPQAPAGPVDEDDIFGDAGTDYVPELPPPKPAAARPAGDAAQGADGEADMEIEEGEVGLPPPPPASTSGQQPAHNPWGYGGGGGAPGAGGGCGGYRDAAYGAGYGADYYAQGGGYGGYPAPPGGGYPAPPDAAAAAAGGGHHPGYHQPPQQKVQQEEPKWRVRPSKAAMLKGFEEEAYGELFPEAAGGGVQLADSDDEGGGKPGEGPEGAAAGKGGKKGAAAAAGGGNNDANKLNTQVQAIQKVFADKGYGHEAAFKKERKLDVGATPARAKRLKL